MSCSGKKYWLSRCVAKLVAKRVKRIGGNLGEPMKTRNLRPYLCPECGMYHLTSTSKRRK